MFSLIIWSFSQFLVNSDSCVRHWKQRRDSVRNNVSDLWPHQTGRRPADSNQSSCSWCHVIILQMSHLTWLWFEMSFILFLFFFSLIFSFYFILSLAYSTFLLFYLILSILLSILFQFSLILLFILFFYFISYFSVFYIFSLLYFISSI